MSSWRELAAERVGAPAPAPVDEIGGVTGDLARSLLTLERMAAPRGVNRSAWAAVVKDAMIVAREGWAASALRLGWTELDLFGIGARDTWDFSGLAVWLAGRKLLVLGEDTAMVAHGEGGRAFFNRGGWGHGKDVGLPSPVLLWQFGRS